LHGGPFPITHRSEDMLSTRDTTSHLAHNWAFDQAEYIGGNSLFLLTVLVHRAFYKTDNPERAPVGQVLSAYSSVPVLMSWTGLSRSTVQRGLTSLQTEHGYITRAPRPFDGEAGRPPRIIQIWWTIEDDAMRSLVRSGRAPLPKEFITTPRQIERRNRVPDLRLYRNDDEVQQL
jgi:hypothetical protein